MPSVVSQLEVVEGLSQSTCPVMLLLASLPVDAHATFYEALAT